MELIQWRKKQEQARMLMQAMIKLEEKKNSERRREEEKKKVERAREAERKRAKKEEEKKKIGQGRGRNARKRKKKEEDLRRKEEEEGLKEHKKEVENNDVHMEGFVEEEKEEEGLRQSDGTENKMRIKENRSLAEFMERQILELEEELECLVCLEVATVAPIYKCPDDHLLCRICRPKLSECPQCRVPLNLSFKRFRGAERKAERLLALRVEKMTIS